VRRATVDLIQLKESDGTMGMWTVPGYTEIRQLGQGGSGRVMLASHDRTGVLVAIKYLAHNLTGDEKFIQEFRGEALILAELDSPYVTRLYEYIEVDGLAAIVMELVDGVSMRAMLREQGSVEADAALVVLKGSLLGLAAAHKGGVVHRDYKPANVLVDVQGQSKLADFGIAVRSGDQGVIVGTPSYMAPEQWAGDAVTPQTDIYAATATFFECLTGRPPFLAPGNVDRMRWQHLEEPVPVELAPGTVHGLLRRGLAKDPAKRPRDASKFLRELESVARDAYGAGWEAEGRRKLAERVLLLALLLPRPTPPQPPATASSAFAWTRLGKRSMALMSMVIVLAAVLIARVALGDPGPLSTTLADSSVSMPPTLVSPAIASPSPTPSVPPPTPSVPPPTPTATPTATHTKPKKAPPTTPPPTTPPPTPSSSPPPPPPPKFSVLALQSSTGQLCGTSCGWTATTRDTGQGKATLHVTISPISANGALAKPTATWDIPFAVPGDTTWTRSTAQATACDVGRIEYPTIEIQASITVGTAKAITAQPVTVTCFPVLQ
jgi:eukaryotic-like serine/threonine-protein kinase